MSSNAARRMTDEDLSAAPNDVLEGDGEPIREPIGAELERLRAHVSAVDAYIAAGGSADSADDGMARIRRRVFET